MPKIKGQHRTHSNRETPARLINATLELLGSTGFTGTTVRAIGERAGCNPALVSYHFGSANALLLAALDTSSEQRLARYREALSHARSLKDLRRIVRRLYQEDRESGHVAILAELVAGGLVDSRLGPAVAARVGPWVELAEHAIKRVLPTAAVRRRVPSRELAYAVVALFLGLEILGQLTGDHSRGDAVVQRLTRSSATSASA